MRQVKCKEGIGMKNIEMEVSKDKVLTIKVDLTQTFGASGSGKSIIIASTEGNASLDGEYSEIKVGLNVYKKA
jgi:ABC-type glutathione transport system ATPase component